MSRFWYFEVSVGSPSGSDVPIDPWAREPCVSVGLATSAFPLRGKQSGWDHNSIGYHGDDGCIYHASGARASSRH